MTSVGDQEQDEKEIVVRCETDGGEYRQRTDRDGAHIVEMSREGENDRDRQRRQAEHLHLLEPGEQLHHLAESFGIPLDSEQWRNEEHRTGGADDVRRV